MSNKSTTKPASRTDARVGSGDLLGDSDTPRTDSQILVGKSQGHDGYVHAAFARVLEMEISALAAELHRLRAAHQRLQNHDGAILLQSYEEGRGSRYEALSLKYPAWRTQPARALGATYSAWGGREGHDYMEIHWPDKHPLQLILRPDEGELFGFIKIEQDAMNHWRLLRA